jgi:hypothetical protein
MKSLVLDWYFGRSGGQGTSASADSAKDAVPGDETARVPQNLINGVEFKGIEMGNDYKSVLALATVSREAFVKL